MKQVLGFLMDLLSALMAAAQWFRDSALRRQGAAQQQMADQTEVTRGLEREAQALQAVANAPEALERALQKGDG